MGMGCILACNGAGGVCPGGVCPGDGLSGGGVYHPLPKTATEAGGTHPTGMHSCLRVISFAPCSDRVSLVPLGVITINLSDMVLVHVTSTGSLMVAIRLPKY